LPPNSLKGKDRELVRGLLRDLTHLSERYDLSPFCIVDRHLTKIFIIKSSEFAGRLLVPLDPLVEEFKLKRKNVLKKYSSWNSPKINNDDLFSMVTPLICGRFDVSAEVIERRLRKENVMDLMG
jgi:hypothetical protein